MDGSYVNIVETKAMGQNTRLVRPKAKKVSAWVSDDGEGLHQSSACWGEYVILPTFTSSRYRKSGI